MTIAYILFDGITMLDFIGIYDPISRLKSMNYIPNLQWDLCAQTAVVQDSFGLQIHANAIQPDLSSYNMLIVPGGFGTRPLQFNQAFLDWLRTAAQVPYKVSVCTGSLLLGAAGFLHNKVATTHFNAYANLLPYCQEVLPKRIVADGQNITAGAVASSLDIGLYICKQLAGEEAMIAIAKSMDYSITNFDVFEV